MKKWIVCLIACLLPAMVVANVFICPKTFQGISVGDTKQKVVERCGQPISKQEGRRAATESTDVTQWIYSSEPTDTTVNFKPSIMFVLKDRKIMGIVIAGQRVQSTNLCNSGNVISVGEDDIALREACGPPNFVNQSKEESVKGIIKYELWTFDLGPYRPKLILQFEGDQVTSIKN